MLYILCLFLNFFAPADYATIEKRPEFINVFESDIYSTYLNQRDAFLMLHTQAIAQMANEPHCKDLHDLLTCKGERGAVYQIKFMNALREALRKKEKASPSVQLFLDNFSVWLFGGPQLESPIRKFINQELHLSLDEVATHDPQKVFMDVHNVVMQEQKFIEDKKTGRTLQPEDNLLYGELPSYLFNMGPVEVIRTSNVAGDLIIDKHGKTLTAEMDPEFFNYIETLAKRNQQHLYVNLLSRKNWEFNKATLIENLEYDPQTSHGIIVISLDKEKESPFYVQTAPYDTLEDTEAFKTIFIQKLLEPNGAYYWSKKIDHEKWPSTLAALIDEVHHQYFNHASSLDVESRKDFIELVYVKIIEKIAQELRPIRLNVTCKQAADRGPSLYTLLFLYDRSKHGTLQPRDYAEALTFAFGPPLAFHDRASHVYRISTLQTAANRLIR